MPRQCKKQLVELTRAAAAATKSASYLLILSKQQKSRYSWKRDLEEAKKEEEKPLDRNACA
jgi:hypothetical protein